MTALSFAEDRFFYDPELDAHADDRSDSEPEGTTWDDAGAPWGNQTIAHWGND